MSRNSDNYKKAFGALHAPDHISLEVDTMERKANKHVALGPALALVAALTLGGAGTAYATDLGGFRTTVNAWLAGEQRTMVAEPIDDDSYEFTVLDGEGNPRGEAAGAPHIARQRHHARGDSGARGETAGDGERAVGAGVVDDDQVVGLACLPVDACEAFGKQVFAIVGDHDGGDGIAHGSKHTRGACAGAIGHADYNADARLRAIDAPLRE